MYMKNIPLAMNTIMTIISKHELFLQDFLVIGFMVFERKLIFNWSLNFYKVYQIVSRMLHRMLIYWKWKWYRNSFPGNNDLSM